MSKSASLKSISKRIRSVNARILNTRKRYGDDSSIVKRIDFTLEKIYGEGVKYYSLPKDVDLRTLNKIVRGVELVENSLYTSKAGRRELRAKVRESFKQSELHDFSDTNIEKMYDLFESEIWPKLREIMDYGSDLFLNELDDILNDDNDMEDIKKYLGEYNLDGNIKISPLDYLKQYKPVG